MPKRRAPRPEKFGVVDTRQPHFSMLYHIVFDQYGADLKPHGLATYWALVRCADNKDHTSYPSHQYIAEHTGQSVAQVKVSLKRLETFGLIHRRMRRPKTSVYTILDVPERPPNSQEVAIDTAPPNSQEVAINSQEVAIEQLPGSYELNVVELDPQNDTHHHPQTPSDMTPSASMTEPVVEVVAPPVASAHGEETKNKDGDMGCQGGPLWRQFYDLYPSHGAPQKTAAAWDREGCDADTLQLIFAKLPWQRTLTGRRALPDLPHKYLSDRRWLDAHPYTPEARSWVGSSSNGHTQEPPQAPRCKEFGCEETPGDLSDTRCDRHTLKTLAEEASRVLGQLAPYAPETAWDTLADAIWGEVAHYHQNGDARAVRDLCVSCWQSIGPALTVDWLTEQIARVVREYRAKPTPTMAAVDSGG